MHRHGLHEQTRQSQADATDRAALLTGLISVSLTGFKSITRSEDRE